MGQAFDEAWTCIERNFSHDPDDIEKARVRLAHALLAVAIEGDRDVAMLRNKALQTMAVGYEQKPGGTSQASS